MITIVRRIDDESRTILGVYSNRAVALKAIEETYSKNIRVLANPKITIVEDEDNEDGENPVIVTVVSYCEGNVTTDMYEVTDHELSDTPVTF